MAIKRALVVDDSRSARLALRRLLEKQSLAVSEAESGEIALDMPQSAAVDVVFMDHTMPGYGGAGGRLPRLKPIRRRRQFPS